MPTTSGDRSVAVIVAHPDDETLWAGGELLVHPEWDCFILSLCRSSDPDRAPRFRLALRELGATGAMADLEDGPDQEPLEISAVAETILRLLAGREFDLVLTHAPFGEYTRHLRHEETARATVNLWRRGELRARSLMLFAYEDDGGRRLPRARPDAHLLVGLSTGTWRRKHRIITEVYGFSPDSWEARTTPRQEAFYRFHSIDAVDEWQDRRELDR